MIGQKTIHSFFSPVSKKRISKELNETEDDAKDPVSLSTQIYFPNWLSISHMTHNGKTCVMEKREIINNTNLN